MTFRSIQKRSTPVLVMREILNSIEAGQLKPGDRLPPERELTKMFGVGRSTIREATSALTLLGYLEVTQGRGTFLSKDLPLSKPTDFALNDIQAVATIIDMVEVREVLECHAVRLAAERADAEDIDRLRRAVRQMKATTADLEQFIRHDFEFHIALARATGNQMIHAMMQQIVENVHGEYEKFMPKALFRRDQAALTAEEILTHLLNREGEAAAAAMTTHLHLVTTELKRLLPDPGWIRKKRL
jgi:GntR family transcriptional repressor for pyruvate dehydrogenase complex